MPSARTFRELLSLIICLTLLAWLAPVAKADPIFSFSDSPSPTPITSGGSTITLTGGSGSLQDAGFTGGANETILTISLASNTLSPGSDSFNSTINFPLTITDVGSGLQNTISFTGTLSGSLNSTTSSVFLTSITPSTPLTFSLGGNNYTVGTLSFPVPLVLGDNQINVNISAPATPEPVSFVLWGVVGMIGVWYARRNPQENLAV